MPRYNDNGVPPPMTADFFDADRDRIAPLKSLVLDDPAKLQQLYDLSAVLYHWGRRFEDKADATASGTSSTPCPKPPKKPLASVVIGEFADHGVLQELFDHLEGRFRDLAPARPAGPGGLTTGDGAWRDKVSGLIGIVPHVAELILGARCWEPDSFDTTGAPDTVSPSWGAADEGAVLVVAEVSNEVFFSVERNCPWGAYALVAGNQLKPEARRRREKASKESQHCRARHGERCMQAATQLRDRLASPESSGTIPDVLRAINEHGEEDDRRVASKFTQALKAFVRDASRVDNDVLFDAHLKQSAERLCRAFDAWSETCLPLVQGPRNRTKSHVQHAALQALRHKVRGWIANATRVALLASADAQGARVDQTVQAIKKIGELIRGQLKDQLGSRLVEPSLRLIKTSVQELDSRLVPPHKLRAWRRTLGTNAGRAGQLIQALLEHDASGARGWTISEMIPVLHANGLLPGGEKAGSKSPQNAEQKKLRALLSLMQSAGVMTPATSSSSNHRKIRSRVAEETNCGPPENKWRPNPLGVALVSAPDVEGSPAAKPVGRRASKRSKSVKKSTPRRPKKGE